MNLDIFIRILWARRIIIAAIALTAILVAALITFMTPKSYMATTELIIDGKGQDPISGQMLPARLMVSYIATQADIIRSRNVANKVIDQKKLLNDPAIAHELGVRAPELPARGLVLSYLRDGLTVAPQRDSSVLGISFSSRNPALAASLADAFAQAYMQTNLELRIAPAKQITQWYDQQLAALRSSLIEKQNALSTYQEEHSILASSDRLDLETSKLEELSSMLLTVQGERLNSQSRSDQIAGAKRGALPAQALDNPQVQQLSGELAQAQARLSELGSQVGENHPQYRVAKGEVDVLQRQLDRALDLISGSLRSTVQLSKAREDQLTAEVAAQKDRVLLLSRNRNQLTLLKQEADSAQAAYDAALNRSAQTKLESQIALTDIAILNTAVTPTRPTSPKPAMNLLLAAMMGLLGGVAIALCREWMDRRIRSAHDLERGLGIPVLARIPSEQKTLFGKEAAA